MKRTKILFLLSPSLLVATAALAAPATPAVDVPTWSEDVAPIVFDRCVNCHRPGQAAPMSLLSYQEARPWARSIARNVSEGRMPPWHASGGTASFTNDRSLSESERDTLVRWATAGAPAGELTSSPEPPAFPETEWKLGEPDFVVTLDEVSVAAGDEDQFHNLIGKVSLGEDRWIKAVEIQAGNPKVVHHVIIYAIKGFNVDPQEGWLGAWAAGAEPMVFPEKTGRLLKRGSNLLADMHYHPAETDERDVTRIGLHFAEVGEVEKELTNIWIANTEFEIPAGAADHQVLSSHTFWQDGRIMTLTPHMHYRGKSFKYTITWPDGRQLVPLEVNDYDFNWQTVYYLEEPIRVTEGTRVECVAHYDNSTENPDNPDPGKAVRFGPESYDEMMIGFVDFIVDEGVAPLTPLEIRTRKLGELAAQYPGEVYAVTAKEPEKRSEPHSFAPLRVPKQGEGFFYVIWNRQLNASRVHSILWKGNRFEAKLESPYGDFDFTGEVKRGGKLIETLLYLPEDRRMPWTGELKGP